MTSAYLSLMARFHPDSLPGVTGGFRKKLVRLCESISEARAELYSRAARTRAEREVDAPAATAPANRAGGGPASGDGGDHAFDRSGYARELYARAQRFFEIGNYWDVVQLCQQAIGVDDSDAEFHFLLGRALMQNPRWRMEAAQSLRKAAELAPRNLDYLGTLAALYKFEGLQTRSNKLLLAARAIEPHFVLPELKLDA
jgi:tetratricopeptide (TPR) repeat protein